MNHYRITHRELWMPSRAVEIKGHPRIDMIERASSVNSSWLFPMFNSSQKCFTGIDYAGQLQFEHLPSAMPPCGGGRVHHRVSGDRVNNANPLALVSHARENQISSIY